MQTIVQKPTIRRALIIFTVLVLLFLSATFSAVYAGWQSGELVTKVVEPVKIFAQKISESIVAGLTEDKSPSGSSIYTRTNVTVESRSETNVTNGSSNSNTNGKTRIDFKAPEINTFPVSTPFDADSWWKQVQAENQAKSEQSKQLLEEFQKQSQQNMEEFRLESERRREEFKQKYGF